MASVIRGDNDESACHLEIDDRGQDKRWLSWKTLETSLLAANRDRGQCEMLEKEQESMFDNANPRTNTTWRAGSTNGGNSLMTLTTFPVDETCCRNGC